MSLQSYLASPADQILKTSRPHDVTWFEPAANSCTDHALCSSETLPPEVLCLCCLLQPYPFELDPDALLQISCESCSKACPKRTRIRCYLRCQSLVFRREFFLQQCRSDEVRRI